jgi:ABC-type Na+ efflux pump permease subunit
MKTVLTIARYEVLRLRSRFSGKTGAIMLPVLLLAIVLSFTMYHQGFSPGKGIYTIGVESENLFIDDARFSQVVLDTPEAEQKLVDGAIDLYLQADGRVWCRQDERSQYALGALKKDLEKSELNRIAADYDLDRAFPLRVAINYQPEELNTAGLTAELIQNETGRSVQAPAESAQTVNTAGQPDNDTTEQPEIASIEVEPPAFTEAEIQDKLEDRNTADIQTPSVSGSSDPVVVQQLEEWQSGGAVPEFKAEFVSEDDIIIPSLMTPPMPLSQVIIAFLYIIPMFFISVFFTSSFTEEKINHKLVILLSSPVTRLQVIFGKMLPYYAYSVLVIIAVTLFLKGNLALAMAVFLPVMLFIFAIYLMVALTYRTFKDQTFFSVLALSVITLYLVVPAMFTGVSELSYASPLTLAVQMYRGEGFTINQYLIATLPLYFIFFLSIYIGRRVFNEEYLMGFKPLRVKALEAVYLSLNQEHPRLSIMVLSLLLIPVVFAVQLVAIIIISNLPAVAMAVLVMLASIVIEEAAKSLGIYALIKYKPGLAKKEIIILAAFSALGFWLGEMGLLLLAANLSQESGLVSLFLGSGSGGGLLYILPLLVHFISTSAVGCLAAGRRKRGYLWGLLCGSVLHALYNAAVLFASGAFR